MQIGSSRRAINASQLLFLSLGCWSSISWANILKDIPSYNPLHIYYDPAPPPEEGPPLSRGALRDPATLPAEVGGIVGAYVFCVIVIGVGLIIVGRRARQLAERAAKARDIEMVAPPPPSYKVDPSPSTPGNRSRNFSWPSPEKTDRNPYIFPASSTISIPHSPPGVGDPYVDSRVVEADREIMGRNLEDLYAHAFEQEDAKAAGVDVKDMPLPAPLAAVGPVPPPAPQRQGSPDKKSSKLSRRPSALTVDDGKSPKLHSRSSSIMSSIKSPGKRKTIRGLISSPIPTPLSSTFPQSAASDEEPLSPRFYAPPPPPPVPTDQAPYNGHNRNTSSIKSLSPTRSFSDQYQGQSSYDPTAPQPNNRSITHFQTHRSNPSQTSVRSSSTRGDPTSAISATSQTPLYPLRTHTSKPNLQPPPAPTKQPPPLSFPGGQKINTQTQTQNEPTLFPIQVQATRALPFRAFDPPLASPSFTHTTKTTVLERTSPLSPGLNTAGQPRTPWSAGAVPYSPYQPFTPMVPVTPRLVTREERKVMEKSKKGKPVLEMIKGEDELWDSAY